MNDIVAYMCGQLTAYMLVRLIVMTARGKFFVLVFCSCLSTHGQDVLFNIHNDSGVTKNSSALSVHRFGSFGGMSFMDGIGSITAGATKQATAGAHAGGGSWLVYADSNVIGGPFTDADMTFNGTHFVVPDVLNWSGAPSTFTNHVFSITYTNTNSFGASFVLQVYTNGVLQAERFAYFGPGEGVDGTFTNGVQTTWQILGPGGPENDFQPVVKAAGSSSPDVSSNQASTTVAEPDPVAHNPREWIELRPTNSFTGTDLQEAAKNAELIQKAINEQGNFNTVQITNALGRLGDQLGNIYGGITNLSLNLTNQAPENNYSNLLQQIATNTAMTTNFLSNLLSTNVPLFSNFINAGFLDDLAAGSNAFEASLLASNLDGTISGVQGTVTNQGSAGSPGTAFLATIGTPSGASVKMDFDLLRTVDDSATVSEAKAQIGKWMRFLREWLLKLVPFVTFWLCTWEIIRWQYRVHEAFQRVPMTLEVTPWKALGKVIVKGVLAVLLGLFLGYVPTRIVAYSQGLMDFGSVAVPSMVDHFADAESGSEWLGAAIGAFNMLAEGIPFTTVVFAAANYGAFLVYGHRLVLFVHQVVLRIMPWLAAVAIVATIETGGTQVQLQNLSGTNSVWAHESLPVVLDFPVGSHALNLEPGDWTIQSSSNFVLEVPDVGERMVVRVESGGRVAWAFAEGEWSWFFAGLLQGIPLWGVVAAVSILRSMLVQATRAKWPGED